MYSEYQPSRMMTHFATVSVLALWLMLISAAQAFAPPIAGSAVLAALPTTSLSTATAVSFPSSLLTSSATLSTASSPFLATTTFATPTAATSPSMILAAATVDPTTFLSDVLGGVIGTPLILAVPIVAALAIAGLVAYFIISYANPEVEDDE